MDKTTRFDSFWSHYPNKKGKGAARTQYEKQEKLHGEPQDFLETVLSAIAVQTRYRKQQQGIGQFVPQWKNPSTWLNQECWTDEVQLDEREKGPSITTQCSRPNCINPVHGPRFDLCEEHYAWRKGMTLVDEVVTIHAKLSEECQTTEQWRAKFKELAEIGLGGKL